MPRFKTGDRVECIKTHGSVDMYERGWRGTVEADGTLLPVVNWDNGIKTACSEERLKYIGEETMNEKYIIYTMGVKEINEAVQKVLFEKGYRWLAETTQDGILKNQKALIDALRTDENNLIFRVTQDEFEDYTDYKELTFRELLELPPVHDELEELAKKLVNVIQNNTEWTEGRILKSEYCKLWEKMKPKLGL